MLPGTHDFTAFTPTQTTHVRFERDVMRAEWLEEPDDVLAFWIEADTFMRHMVRTLVGTMLAVAERPLHHRRLRPSARGPAADRGGGDGGALRPLPRERSLLSRLYPQGCGEDASGFGRLEGDRFDQICGPEARRR